MMHFFQMSLQTLGKKVVIKNLNLKKTLEKDFVATTPYNKKFNYHQVMLSNTK